MHETGCLNCGSILLPNQKFCSVCGQKADTRRLTIRQLLYDFAQVFISTDKGILKLIKGLVLHPGRVAAEYVEGKRKTYFNPFAFMALCVGFMVLINNWLKPYEALPEPRPEVLARISDQKTKEVYLLTVDRIRNVQGVVNKNLNTASVLVAPYYALFLWLFFRRRGRNFSEIIVAYLLLTAFSNIVSTVLFSPWLAYLRDSSAYYPVQITSYILQTAYLAWGMKTFFHYKTIGGYIKMFAALSLTGIIGFILLFAAYFLFVYRGAYDILRYL